MDEFEREKERQEFYAMMDAANARKAEEEKIKAIKKEKKVSELEESGKEIRDGYFCDDCGEVIDPEQDDVDVALYECGSCGTIFNRNNSYSGDNHQCPDCLKFASKLADQSCPHCEQAEVRECKFYENEEGELVEVE